MNKETEKKIYVAGHKGMVGSAIVWSLIKKGFNKKLSKELVLILANGTLEILDKSFDFNNLIKKVASKNGTTEKALNFLKIDKDLSLLISQAIYKAEKRSREISKDLLWK